MANGNIVASDYEGVKKNIANMNSEVENIIKAAEEIITSIENAEDWVGIDAVAYKNVLKSYSLKIKNSAGWLRSLNSTISKHAERLHQRAERDSRSITFR